ncbi:hypothetical protein [Kitasatospora sp. NPDC097691]|uniref:hypothetical protein n=1 Tax=Kitasatospora sp. NPDC097691 TaxID=3157231 RepID=UPI00332505D2
MRPGSRTRLCHRLRTHPAGRGKLRSMGECDFIALIDGVHQLVKAPIVLVWDRDTANWHDWEHLIVSERAVRNHTARLCHLFGVKVTSSWDKSSHSSKPPNASTDPREPPNWGITGCMYANQLLEPVRPNESAADSLPRLHPGGRGCRAIGYGHGFTSRSVPVTVPSGSPPVER